MAIKDYSFPGIYSNETNVVYKKPGFKISDYFKQLYDQKLDKKDTPNTVYAVDDKGRQVMVDINDVINVEDKIIEILNQKDAPADDKQYARENKNWEEVELYKIKLTNTIINTNDWISDGGSGDFPFEYRIYNEKITKDMIPEVIFSEQDALQCNFSPICESFNGYVSIYAHQIPKTDIIIPVITLQ